MPTTSLSSPICSIFLKKYNRSLWQAHSIRLKWVLGSIRLVHSTKKMSKDLFSDKYMIEQCKHLQNNAPHHSNELSRNTREHRKKVPPKLIYRKPKQNWREQKLPVGQMKTNPSSTKKPKH